MATLSIKEAYDSVDKKLVEAKEFGQHAFMITFAEAAALLTEIDDLRKAKERMKARLEDIAANVRRAQQQFE